MAFIPTVEKKPQKIDYQGTRITHDFVYCYIVSVRVRVKCVVLVKNMRCYTVYQRKLSCLSMAKLNWRVGDRSCSKTGLLPSVADQKRDEDWLVWAAWTSCKINIDTERWFSFIHQYLNKFSG